MVLYYNDKGFQLGNLLYLLLQAHQDRYYKVDENAAVLRTGWFQLAQAMFPKTMELFAKANGETLYPFSYFQTSGIDFTSEALDSFCKEYLLEPTLEQSRQYKKADICLAVRRTDYLKGKNLYYYGFDLFDYVFKALNYIKEQEQVEDLSRFTLRITSDDTEWCAVHLVSKLQDLYGFRVENVWLEQADRRENFFQLFACNKYLISPNSTFVYWVGYLLRVANPSVQVFVPNFNTTLLSEGKQIADTRNWIVLPVDRTGYTEKEG